MNVQPPTNLSVPLSELTLDQLVQLSQGMGRQIDSLREQRAYLRKLIDARLAAGQRDGVLEDDGNAVAPGALIESSAH